MTQIGAASSCGPVAPRLAIQDIRSLTQSNLSSPPAVLLELCAGGIEDVRLAAQLKVDRIELNSGMALGGLTPSAGLVAAARKEFSGPMIAMVRPREGGFLYSSAEFMQMLDDCEFLLARGVDGIAIGLLKADGTVDQVRCRKLRAVFPKTTLVFHRAFDVTPDLPQALQQLIDCRFQRILTSGGKPTASEGAGVLRQLQSTANGRIEILAGGGVRAANVAELLKQSGCHQIHSAVRIIVEDPSSQKNPAVHFGIPGTNVGGCFGAASEEQLVKLQAAIAASTEQ